LFDALAEHISGYPGFAVVCASCGIVLPLPEDVPLIWAGMRIAAGEWTWAPTLTAAIIGVQVRDWAAWAVGRALGETVLDSPWVTRLFGRRRLARAQRMVLEHGALAVLIGRFFVGFRTPVFLMAGAVRLPFREFARWDAFGILLTVPIVVFLGYEVGQPLLDAIRWGMARARFAAVAVTLLGVVWLVACQRRPRTVVPPETAPSTRPAPP